MSKQSHKAKTNLPAGGFLAIGRDMPSTSDTSRVKPLLNKRELPQVTVGILKKPRLDFSSKVVLSSSSVSSQKRNEVDDSRWRCFCAEVHVEPRHLLLLLESAKEKQKPQKAARLICAALRDMSDRRKDAGSWTVEPALCSALLNFIKMNAPFLTSSEELIEGLCSLLSTNFPSSPCSAIAPLLLYKVLKEMNDWNWKLVETFMDDSLHDRQWVDRPAADELAKNIMTAFGTRIPHESMYTGCELVYPERFRNEVIITNRFTQVNGRELKIEVFVSRMKDICERKGESAPRNLLKTMCTCAGNASVRLLAARKMDSWLLNGKLQRYAMELLLWIACNMGQNELTDEDRDTLCALLKLRALKSKQINTLFNVALKEILSNDKGIMCAVTKLLLSNEFSTNRFPYNMTMIHALFSFDNRSASRVLAREISQMLAAKEEYLRVSRTFLREFVRSLLRVDFDFALFTAHLLNAVVEDFSSVTTPMFFFKSLIDFCVMLPFLAITPNVREAAQLRRNSAGSLTQIHINALQKFYADLKNFYEICAQFFYKHHNFCCDNRLFVFSYYRVLYLAPADYYASVDQWPTEAEVTHYLRVIADTPISELLLSIILKAGSDLSVPIDATDTVDVIENITKRASMSYTLTGGSMIQISNCTLLETLFKITAYKPPATFNIQEEDLPSLAVKTLYWKAWLISLIWAALNKETLLKEVYCRFPNLKLIMQIVLTWDYSFPPMTSVGDQLSAEKMIENDEKAAYEEKKAIKILEAKLAGTEVTDSNSKLLNKVCSLDITGVCRRLPDNVMRDLEKLNEDLDLSRLLSECRDPDLLADIVRSQGSSKALPPIINLVESNSNAVAHLPLECICELFMHYISSASASNSVAAGMIEKLSALRNRLRSAAVGSSATRASVFETLEYLAAHLAAHSASERCAAAHSLTLLLDYDANIQILPVVMDALPAAAFHRFAYFDELKHRICVLLSQACSVETDLNRLSDYLTFLIEHSDSKSLHLRLKDGTEADVIRINAIEFYERYFREVEQDKAEWTEELEALLPSNVKKVLICIEKPNKTMARLPMISTGINGMLQLLCSQWQDKNKMVTRVLMDLWFPISGKRPKVLSADSAELLPTWLKLKMLRTEDDRIIRVAMDDMKVEDALRFVQSFGLTSYACSKILAILDADETPLDGNLLKEAEKASLFVRGYKLQNAKGGDVFLSRIAAVKSIQKSVKIEADGNIDIKLSAPPKIFNEEIVDPKRILMKQMSAEEIITCIELAVQENREPEQWPSLISKLSHDTECCRAVISFLQENPIILTSETVARPLLISLITARNKDPSLMSDFDSMLDSVIIQTKIHIPDSVKRFLCSRGGECAIEMESPFSPNYNTYDPESILMRLSNSMGMGDMQNRLLERFLDTYPEILPYTDDYLCCKSHTILEIIFSSEAPALLYIISLLPTACSSTILSKIIQFLLSSYRPQFISMSVIRAIISSFRFSKTSSFSAEQCSVFIQYILAAMENNFDNVITLLMNFLKDNTNSDITQKLVADISSILKSPTDILHKPLIQQVANAFVKHFPDSFLKNDTVVVNSFRSICTQDRTVHDAIVELFSSAAATKDIINDKISALSQIVLHQPCVVLRHMPLLTACMASVAQLPGRQLRAKGYQALLHYILKLLLDLAPQSFQEREHLHALLQEFFTLFENVGCGRTWVSLGQQLQCVCVKYLELNAKSAKSYFMLQMEAIKQLCSCMKSPYSKVLVDMIACLSRSEE
ncbi:unnamed protein product [Thelazia callipaeda]|uniref:DUF3677 domain-containing protein n=1 Tax=Thelazia callipaeda TaxID=103827 RepID=A0A0N5CU08_THECL|nr:unnamed protein product [Thelazia callipaeda]